MKLGGDWETGVFIIFYYDGENFRAYIPIKGNTIRTDNFWAFGNDEEFEDDLEYITDEDYLKQYGITMFEYLRYNKDEIIKDISSNIIVK